VIKEKGTPKLSPHRERMGGHEVGDQIIKMLQRGNSFHEKQKKKQLKEEYNLGKRKMTRMA